MPRRLINIETFSSHKTEACAARLTYKAHLTGVDIRRVEGQSDVRRAWSGETTYSEVQHFINMQAMDIWVERIQEHL